MLQQPIYPAVVDDDYSAEPIYPQQQQRAPEFVVREYSAIFTEIDRLEETILNSPRVPLTGKTMVNEEELLVQLDLIRSSIPAALKTAQEILEYKNQIIQEAQQQAQQLIAEANLQAYQVANELGIIDRAEVEAQEIRQQAIAEAEQIRQQATLEMNRIRHHSVEELERMRQIVTQECQQMQDGADEYADRVLSTMEFQLSDALHAVQRGRQQIESETESIRTDRASQQELTSLGDRVIISDRRSQVVPI
jgi:vacuolar-type H+-ATPase subunit H